MNVLALAGCLLGAVALECIALACWHAFVTSGYRKDEPGDEWGPVLGRGDDEEEGGGQ